MPKIAKPRKKGNRWEISYYDADGKRRFATFRTKTEANLAQSRLKSDAPSIKAGLKKRELPSKTFVELCEKWLLD